MCQFFRSPWNAQTNWLDCGREKLVLISRGFKDQRKERLCLKEKLCKFLPSEHSWMIPTNAIGHWDGKLPGMQHSAVPCHL
jgi:hypothetical protein